MAKVLTQRLCRQTVLLHPERALFWKDAGTLIVADLHFGKPQIFREKGIPVPAGTTLHDLQRLSDLIDRFNPAELVFLGDLIHGPLAFQDELSRPVNHWRERHSRLRLHLVTGNHDRRAGDPPPVFRFDGVSAELIRPPFRFTHQSAADGGHYGIAGHLHPAVVMTGKGRQKEILPCFRFGRRGAILPAFGSFTGCQVIRVDAADRVYVIAGEEIIEA